jgi:hypothetical protein
MSWLSKRIVKGTPEGAARQSVVNWCDCDSSTAIWSSVPFGLHVALGELSLHAVSTNVAKVMNTAGRTNNLTADMPNTSRNQAGSESVRLRL